MQPFELNAITAVEVRDDHDDEPILRIKRNRASTETDE